MPHLYIHIPFCRKACHYCDFHFSTSLTSKSEMVRAIGREIELQKDYLPTKHLTTIYLGGGTPSLLSVSELGRIFDAIGQYFSIDPQAEITLEANPDDLTPAKLTDLKSFVNRLSIGIQSFYEPYLQFMNRTHNAMEAETCVKQAQEVGFENLTIDLMYGMSPYFVQQSPASTKDGRVIWQADLGKATSLGVSHISSYNLTIEPQTALGKWLKKGSITPLDEEQSALQFEMMVAYLMANGFEHYEISNFAKKGFYARHNTSYWQREPYLGVGPSAHSFDGTSRQYNIANNAHYIKSLNKGQLPAEKETLTIYDQVNDYLLTSLRTVWGCDLGVVAQICGFDFYDVQKTTIGAFIRQDWLMLADNKLLLTTKGKLFADRIAADLFLV
ncbi:MAG: radical SAM family heme chaperone HemW [Runella sp.]